MATVLLVSSNSMLADEVKDTLSAGAHALHVCADGNEALEWTETNSFDLIVVDDESIEQDCLDFLFSIWDQNSLSLGILINTHSPIARQWDAKLAGAEIFQGSSAIMELKKFLKEIELRQSSVEDFSILMVEDLDAPREIICKYVSGMGYPNVQGVESADAALELLHSAPRKFDCIISDMNMPGLSGAEFTALIRKDSELQHLPVIVLTAYATPENLIDCVKAGASGFLVKPPRKKALKRELEKARRLVAFTRSARLCSPEDAYQLEEALAKIASL